MRPPFSPEQFFDVFHRYNEAVWPAQVFLTVLALFIAFAAYRANVRRSWHWAQLSIVLLASLWLWTGIAYHKVFFAAVTPAAEIFGSAFIAQAAVLLISVTQNGHVFDRASRSSAIVGAALLVYALIAYPAIGMFAGHRYPDAPSFGTPCPTTIFTFGIYCLLPGSIPRFAIAIPVLWAAIASWAAIGFGVVEDLGLVVAAIAAIAVIHSDHIAVARRRMSQLNTTPPMPSASRRM